MKVRFTLGLVIYTKQYQQAWYSEAHSDLTLIHTKYLLSACDIQGLVLCTDSEKGLLTKLKHLHR